MHGVAVAFLTDNQDRFRVLQHRLENSQIGRAVFSHIGFPAGPTDPVLRQLQDAHAEVVLVDIDPENIQRAIRAIELIHSTTNDIVIFAIGEMVHPPTIVAAMRAGAREYLERQATSESLMDALGHFSAARGKSRTSSGRARVFTVLNAKGGAGATTIAVNTAVALQEAHGSVVLVDFAPLGHASLHLNARPAFGLPDALQNLHRMDSSLLEGLMTQCKGGLHLLAGPQQPYAVTATASELARLFDLLVSQYRYVVVDCSNRADSTARLLCDLSNAVLLTSQADVVSLWSASRMYAFLEEGTGRDRVRLVLNRYKKIPGFSDDDITKATNCKILWKIPNNYQSVGPAIDKGTPVVFQENQDISRSFRALAAALSEATPSSEGSMDLAYGNDKTDTKKKPAGRLLITPMRAGQ